jgi:transcriptional regulator with XRE-family HTH domain
VDARSFDEAWKKIWDNYEKTNCIPSPADLRKARENLNLTQEEIALLLGRTKSLVSKLEDGSRALSDKLLESYSNYIIPGGDDFISFVNAAAVQGRISPDDRDRIVDKTGIRRLNGSDS